MSVSAEGHGRPGRDGAALRARRRIARTPEPPYYVVVFTSVRSHVDDGYDETSRRMVELAAEQPGFLGIESVRDGEFGVTVSYWDSPEAITRWKRQVEHRAAQEKGRQAWYRRYRVRVARVEREHGFESAD